MARTPQNLEEAKQIYREEKAKVTGAFSALAGSRWTMAILATLVLAFGSHWAFAPMRLPEIAITNAAHFGLPEFDFGELGIQAQQAWTAFWNSDAPVQAQQRLAAETATNENFVRTLNAVGFGVASVLLLGNMWVMTKRRRYTRG